VENGYAALGMRVDDVPGPLCVRISDVMLDLDPSVPISYAQRPLFSAP
jgi:hypothetical protein